MRDVGMADRLRAEGLAVVEIDGWRTRGSESFTPRGSVDHHTAGARTGNAPSLGVCINGRGDLPGPLCNVLVGRDNTCYVIAAGRANHAGKGGWRGLTGNSSVYGVERENVGTPSEPWRADQTTAAARVHAALIRGTANPMHGLVCEHKEWAPGRKSDAHSLSGDSFRHLVDAYLNTTGDPDMAFGTAEAQQLNQIYQWALANQRLNEEQLLEKILQRLDAHIANPNTGGGAGSVDMAALRDELADELAERLAS